MIAIGGYYDESADLTAEVSELKELGLAGLKLKVGGLEPEQDAVHARLARDAGGDGFILAADANQGWTPEQEPGLGSQLDASFIEAHRVT